MPLQEHTCEEFDCGEKGCLKAPIACRSAPTAPQHDSSARVLPLLHYRPVSRVNERRDDTLHQLPCQRLNIGERSGGLLAEPCLNHDLRWHPGADSSDSTPSFCCRGEALGRCIATKDAAPIFLRLVMAGAGRMIASKMRCEGDYLYVGRLLVQHAEALPDIRQGGWISGADALGADLQQHVHALRQGLPIAQTASLHSNLRSQLGPCSPTSTFHVRIESTP